MFHYCFGFRILVGRKLRSFVLVCLAAGLLSGCLGVPPSFREPDRLVPIEDQFADARNYVESLIATYPNPSASQRNSIITAYMFAIDIAYTKYEAQLTHEMEAEGFGTAAVIQALSTTGSLVAAPTTHILSGITAGVNGLDSAYNQKILLSNAMQNLQTQMRSDRSEQAGYIYSNMKCAISAYPLGMAMSDLELYYRAGTMPSALIGLSKTVNKADTDAKATKQANAPSSPPAAQAQLKASADVTKAKANPKPSCQLHRPGDA